MEGSTQSDVEIRVTKFHCVHKAVAAMPFQMVDACRPDLVRETDVGAYDQEANRSAEDGGRVGQETRLDHRWIDLRTPANQSIFRIQSAVCTLFREYLLSQDFVEIHTPKLLSGASEGGADVFTLDYFGRPACLSMSPQLHKQMAAACGGFERVFEIGPVFRAENSNTRRHLCEFTGLDLEMAINEHYDEVLDVLGDLFVYIFDGLKDRCGRELERVKEQHGFDDLLYLKKTLKIDFATGCRLLREAGVDQGDYDDLSTENEKKLGDIVKEKYGTEFYIMDKYPLSVRPFYTMPDPSVSSSLLDNHIRGAFLQCPYTNPSNNALDRRIPNYPIVTMCSSAVRRSYPAHSASTNRSSSRNARAPGASTSIRSRRTSTPSGTGRSLTAGVGSGWSAW